MYDEEEIAKHTALVMGVNLVGISESSPRSHRFFAQPTAPVMYPGEPAATQELPVRLILYAYYMSRLRALSQLKDNLQTVRSIASQRTYHCFLGSGTGGAVPIGGLSDIHLATVDY